MLCSQVHDFTIKLGILFHSLLSTHLKSQPLKVRSDSELNGYPNCWFTIYLVVYLD